ncbi:hypothetical protein [Bacillus sp. FSL W7-1334]|uniref:hypothetical protein n=1 Tax=Bacillus sp. FSL W7-1334 TaxID=2921703 RepID=UPI0040469A78
MCERHTETLNKVTNIPCDGGYTGSSFEQTIKEAIDCSVEIIKHTELHKFVLLPKRWTVERTFFSWKIIEGCGRTVNEYLKIVDRVAYWQVW